MVFFLGYTAGARWLKGMAGGGHQKKVTTSWPVSLTQAFGGSSIPPLPLKYMFGPPFPWWLSFARTQAWESKAWDYGIGIICTEHITTLSRPRHRPLSLRWAGAETDSSDKPPKLKQPPSLQWPVSSSSLSLPSVYADHSVNQQACIQSPHPKCLGRKWFFICIVLTTEGDLIVCVQIL